MKKVIFSLLLVTLLATPAAAQGINGSFGVQLSANNTSFADLDAVDPRAVSLDQLRADTTQDLNAWLDFRVGRVELGGEVHFLTPELGDFSGLTDFWLGTAYARTNLVQAEQFHVYTQLTLRDSADDVQGLEEIFGTLSVSVGTEVRF